MSQKTTYSHARAHLGVLWDEVTSSREPIFIERRGAEDVALVAASELRALMETAHLLRSPANARRMLDALARSRDDEPDPSTVESLRREAGLGPSS